MDVLALITVVIVFSTALFGRNIMDHCKTCRGRHGRTSNAEARIIQEIHRGLGCMENG